MNTEEAWELAEKHWDESGCCNSCGWHASLYEYDKDDIVICDDRIELPCISRDADDPSLHRGITIYRELKG